MQDSPKLGIGSRPIRKTPGQNHAPINEPSSWADAFPHITPFSEMAPGKFADNAVFLPGARRSGGGDAAGRRALAAAGPTARQRMRKRPPKTLGKTTGTPLTIRPEDLAQRRSAHLRALALLIHEHARRGGPSEIIGVGVHLMPLIHEHCQVVQRMRNSDEDDTPRE